MARNNDKSDNISKLKDLSARELLEMLAVLIKKGVNLEKMEKVINITDSNTIH